MTVWFKVVLYDVSGATLGAQTLGAEHRSHVFSGLIPGRLYRTEVITHSGELTNNVSALGRTGKSSKNTQIHINSYFVVVNDTFKVLISRVNIVFFPPAPEPPTHLSVKQGPTNDSIELSWSGPASGDYNSFSLQWTPPDHLSIPQTHLTSRVLGGMFPGRQYNFTVATISGGGVMGGPTVKSQPIQRSVRTSGWKTS